MLYLEHSSVKQRLESSALHVFGRGEIRMDRCSEGSSSGVNPEPAFLEPLNAKGNSMQMTQVGFIMFHAANSANEVLENGGWCNQVG